MQESLSGWIVTDITLEPKNGWETGIQIPILSHFIYPPLALHYINSNRTELTMRELSPHGSITS